MWTSCTERIPARFVLGGMMFWSALTAFLMRVNLSLSIVAMVGHRRGNHSSGTTAAAFNSSGCLIQNASFAEADSEHEEVPGEFDWNETTQGTILSAFFWGYLALQLPGGRLAELIGGRRVLGSAILVASVLCALTPPLTRLHHGFLIAIRVGQGLCLGVQFPSFHVLLARWVPRHERARFTSICCMGGTLGIAFMLPLCGLIISWLGWAALFYVCAVKGLIFTTCWFLMVHDGPDKHPRISETESRYIAESLHAGAVKKLPVPWRHFLTSIQVWAPFLTSFGSDWGFYTVLTLGPKYMASILGFQMKKNSVLSALPFLCRYIFGVLVAQVLDRLLRCGFLSLRSVRRVAVSISHLMPALALFTLSMAGCNPTYAVLLICLGMACNGALTSGHVQASLDAAPNFAGTLAGFKNGLCSFTGIISPLITGAILEQDASVRGWQIVFTLAALIYASSSVLYLLFFTARVQPWNDKISKDADGPDKIQMSALLPPS